MQPPPPFDRASFTMFGVAFIYENAGLDWMEAFMDGWMPPHQAVIREVRWAVDRQRRHYVTYIDVMTWLDQSAPPKQFNPRSIPEWSLYQNLSHSATRGWFRDPQIQELCEWPPILRSRTRHRWHDGKAPFHEAEAGARMNIDRQRRNRAGDLKGVKPGMFRIFEVEMGDGGGSLRREDFNWHRHLVLAVLVQLRADLEIFYETGFQRVGKCRRERCQAWFTRRPTSRTQHFCSDVCRASHFREAGMKGTGRRRQPARA